jgi:hypothetical protein
LYHRHWAGMSVAIALRKSERRHEIHAEFIGRTPAVYTSHVVLTLELS